jgi:CDP-diacylglycerol---serine O-phosphatidyltransferase
MLKTRELMLRSRRRRLRSRPLLHFVPNMFTILGLSLGLTGLRYGLDGRWQLAVALIIAAVITDGLDGRSARMLKVTSRLGAELDSLADFVNFGVAPAILVYLWSLHEVRGIGWAIAILFATCCALRLARFNTELEEPNKPRWTLFFFKGIPAPAAAGLALVPLMLSFVIGGGFFRSWLLNAALLIFVAVMMISTVPTFSVKRVRVKPDYVLPVLLLSGIGVVFLVTEPWLTLSAVGVAYLLSIPASVLVARRMRKEEDTQAAGGVDPQTLATSHPAEQAPTDSPSEEPPAGDPAEKEPGHVFSLRSRGGSP